MKADYDSSDEEGEPCADKRAIPFHDGKQQAHTTITPKKEAHPSLFEAKSPEMVTEEEIEEEEEDVNTMKAFILAKMDKFFVDHLPIESFAELPPGCKLTMRDHSALISIKQCTYFTTSLILCLLSRTGR